MISNIHFSRSFPSKLYRQHDSGVSITPPPQIGSYHGGLAAQLATKAGSSSLSKSSSVNSQGSSNSPTSFMSSNFSFSGQRLSNVCQGTRPGSPGVNKLHIGSVNGQTESPRVTSKLIQDYYSDLGRMNGSPASSPPTPASSLCSPFNQQQQQQQQQHISVAECIGTGKMDTISAAAETDYQNVMTIFARDSWPEPTRKEISEMDMDNSSPISIRSSLVPRAKDDIFLAQRASFVYRLITI